MEGKLPELKTILRTLGEGELARLSRWSSPAWLRAGKALFYQGDETDEAWLLVSGRIRPLRIKGDSSFALDDLLPGSWIGLAELELGLPRPVDALAIEASALIKLNRFNYFQIRGEPWFKDLVIGELARGQYALYSSLDADSATEKVAQALVGRSAGGNAGRCDGEKPVVAPGTLRLALTQTELAAVAGVTRETVNRCLRKLEAAGLLETERASILVYDLAGLKAYRD